jgi:hypothetical protein
MSTPSRKTKQKSLADYLVRHDLAAIMEEARRDYNQASSGTPRLLDQKEIAARFRKTRAPKPPSHE